MPKVDFSHVEDVQDFSPIPAGKYLCKLVEIEEATTQYGDEMWKMRFQVVEGKHTGRYVFDNLVFSEAALKRVKLICSRLGLNVGGELDLKPTMLKDRTCFLTVQTESYEDDEGNEKHRNVVPFAGYDLSNGANAAPAPATPGEESDDHPAF
jgi:hypothetical protein